MSGKKTVSGRDGDPGSGRAQGGIVDARAAPSGMSRITMPAADDVAHVGMAAAPTLVGERADVSIAKGPSMCVMWVDGSGALATDGRRKAKVESNFDLGGAGAFGVPA
ncbi:hypothetical protein WJX75_001547 [Coccomyxa subellipsoidea]|uniref:Uncharacterized protein n=1 Tax=Coccomyxa subellipsoidea TaxID=248742 RepID=A0ABR2YWZ7_9CHLO